MANKKVCDWCEKDLWRGFVYTLETTITYFGGSNEVKPKPDDNVEICENCYRVHVLPIFGWQRDIIIVPQSRAESEHLRKESTQFREEFDRKRKEQWELYQERAKRAKIEADNKPEPSDSFERVTQS